MTQQQMLYLAGALVLGYLVGSGKLTAAAASPAKHNDTAEPAEWWSYAGSWSM